jgi:hypothetical protein
VIFCISIAPKTFFHYAFANHHDNAEACTDKTNSPHLHQAGINCHFDQLVVNNSYIVSISAPAIEALPVFTENYSVIPVVIQAREIPAKESRGPPSHS